MSKNNELEKITAEKKESKFSKGVGILMIIGGVGGILAVIYAISIFLGALLGGE